MSANVSVQEVERVAELAHLELGQDEVVRMQKDLNSILDYVAELNEVNTDGVEPLEQVSALGEGVGRTVLRADELKPSLDRALIAVEAPDTDGVFFRVPKVIER